MKALLSIFFSILFVLSSYAVADISFLFRYYNVENGLSSNHVDAILQDSKGYIWIGTDRGLSRYDGKSFVYYQKRNNQLHRLGNDLIKSLYETPEKTIWVGTYNGLYIYSPLTDQFTFWDVKTKEGVSISSSVGSINQDKDGLYWIATWGQGVFSFDPQSQLLKQYMIESSGGHIYCALADPSNTIWLAGRSSTYILDKVNDRFDIFYYEGKELYSTTLYEDSMHTFWIGTWDKGILKIEPDKEVPVCYLNPSTGKGLLHMHTIQEYAPGMLLIGSDQGLAVFNTVTGACKEYSDEHSENRTLSNKFVYPIVRDREGGFWIGTFFGGVNYIPPHCGQFEGYSREMAVNKLLNGNIISCFAEDAKGNVWIGSTDGGVSCFSPVTQRFIDYPGRQHLLTPYVTDLCIAGDTLWIGTYAEGLYSLDIGTGQFRDHTSYLFDFYINTLYKDSKGRFWVGAGDLYLYLKEGERLAAIRNMGAITTYICEHTPGNIWISTWGNGLFCYEPETEQWKRYGKEKGLPSDLVYYIHFDKYDRLWVGTVEGLSLYQARSDCFEYIPLACPSEDIGSIQDGANGLWLTSGKGLINYNHDTKELQVFSKSDGLQNEDFVGGASLKTRRGKLFLGAINGFNAFYPHKIHQNTQAPPVILTTLELFNEKVPVAEKGILTSRIDQMKEIHLAHTENVISILYAALSYCSPEKNQYAYKLEGFDKDWNYVESQAKATYTNLPAGTYTFHVKASNNDNVWNEKGTSLRIIVHPPLYLTTPFKILYLLIVLLILFCILRLLLSRKERKYVAEIETLNANKDKEIHEAKINFFTTIAHEIRTPVSLIIGPLEVVRNASVTFPPVVSDNLDTIYRNSQRLLFLINQLLDFRKVEDREMKMRFEYCGIADLLQSVCERFHASMVQRTIRFSVEYPDREFMAAVDKEAFTKVVSNLLSNAYKYARNEVSVSCRIYPERGEFAIVVIDNGDGIAPDVQEQIFKPFYQKNGSKPGTGIGLSIVKDLVKAHKGSIEIDSNVGEYASFIVSFPIDQPNMVKSDDKGQSVSEQQSAGMREDCLLPPASVKPTMLIVDDNEEMLQFLGEHFKTHYQIITAIDGMQALDLLKTHEVTLIISDWMMPNMSGLELCKAVRANLLTSHIPFILLTAKTELQSKITGLEEGADAYIEKPFSLHYMEARIHNLIEQRELLRTRFSQMPNVVLSSIARNTADGEFLTRMNDLIEANIDNPNLSIDFFTEQLGISRSGLFVKLKNLANTTPNELIHIIRLKKAAALFLEKNYRVNEVCYMVGFKDPSYFSKCFQKQFGIKPAAYAREYNRTLSM